MVYQVKWTTDSGEHCKVQADTYDKAYAMLQSLNQAEDVFQIEIVKYLEKDEQKRADSLKREIELHFNYYGKEIDGGYYTGFERDEFMVDSMIRDLEGSLRVLKELKELKF